MTQVPLWIQLIILFFSIVVHECSHGWVANRLGDPTARLSGRLTLNPLPHIDIMGTILLPLLLIITRSPILFGWAKPVPINPYNFVNPRRDMMKVALGGPGSNFILALVAAGLFWLTNALVGYNISTQLWMNTLVFMGFINILLAVFNLVPIPPLDGSRIVSGLLPPRAAMTYERITPMGFFIVFILLFTGVLWYLLGPVLNFFMHILFGTGLM